MPARHSPRPDLSDLPVERVAGSVAHRLGVDDPLLVEVATLHVQTLVAAAEWSVPEVLAEQLRWERARLAGGGVTLRYHELRDALLGELAAHVDRVTHARLRVLYTQAEAVDRDRATETEPPLPPRAASYLEAALAGDLARAADVVRTALALGESPAAVIREVLQPAQVEIGRRWQTGAVSIPQEHRATSITTRCMSLFAQPLRSPVTLVPAGAARPRMLAGTIGTESHDLGLRMLAEVMSGEGWDVELLGGAVPAADLVEHVERTRPDVLALSATMAGHVRLVADVVRGSRSGTVTDLKVLVGGRAFTARPDLADAVGADGWAADADGALALCRGWRPEDTTVAPAAPDEPDEPDSRLDGLAGLYRIDAHHVSGALDLLAEHSGLSREELAARLDASRRTGT